MKKIWYILLGILCAAGILLTAGYFFVDVIHDFIEGYQNYLFFGDAIIVAFIIITFSIAAYRREIGANERIESFGTDKKAKKAARKKTEESEIDIYTPAQKAEFNVQPRALPEFRTVKSSAEIGEVKEEPVILEEVKETMAKEPVLIPEPEPVKEPEPVYEPEPVKDPEPFKEPEPL